MDKWILVLTCYILIVFLIVLGQMLQKLISEQKENIRETENIYDCLHRNMLRYDQLRQSVIMAVDALQYSDTKHYLAHRAKIHELAELIHMELSAVDDAIAASARGSDKPKSRGARRTG